MKKEHIKKLILVFALIWFVQTDLSAQCAMCRAVLETEDAGNAAEGINNGIMYLMVFPYLLVGGIGIAIYRFRKKQKAEEAKFQTE